MVLPEGNTVIGVFALQGEINPALLETMRTMGITTPHSGPEMENARLKRWGIRIRWIWKRRKPI